VQESGLDVGAQIENQKRLFYASVTE
jgi:hypothetical protein